MKFSQLMTVASAGILAISCGSCNTSQGTEKACCGEIRADNDDALTVTENGKVAGYVDGNVYVFKGIPYAKAERFMPPVPADNWEGIRSCRYYGPTCP